MRAIAHVLHNCEPSDLQNVLCDLNLHKIFDRRILAKKFPALKKVTALSVILVTFNAVKNNEEKHLILKEMSVMIMKQMSYPLFWTMFASLDVV